MTYADYDYYKEKYLGNSIEKADFPHLALRSSQYLDYITLGKSKSSSDLEAVKMACCAIAEQYQDIEAAQALYKRSLASGISDGAEVQSESVGSWSRSYRSGGESAQTAAQAADFAKSALYQIAQQYLAQTGLLYRGGGRHC